MEVDDVSNVMEVLTPSGEYMYRIVQLKSITKPHRANLTEDYDKISNFAKENKKAQYFNEWVTEKIASTYIKIDSRYNFCDNLSQWIDKAE